MKMFKIFGLVLMMVMFVSTAYAGNTADSTAKAKAAVDQTFEASEIPQNFANGVEMTFPGLPAHLGPDAPDGSVLPLNMIVHLKPIWMREQLKANTEHADIRIRSRAFFKRNKEKGNPEDTIKIIFGAPKPDANLVGIVVAEADDLYTTNLELMSRVALEGFEMEADEAYIVIDGASKVTKTKGWGIGLNHTTATLNGSGDLGTVTSGGTGYSSGEAGFRQKPWIQVFMVKN